MASPLQQQQQPQAIPNTIQDFPNTLASHPPIGTTLKPSFVENDSSSNVQNQQYILYYCLGNLFIRPVGLLTGTIQCQFKRTDPYILRRSNGSIQWLQFNRTDFRMLHDYKHVVEADVAPRNSSSIIIKSDLRSFVYVYGEVERGFCFTGSCKLELTGYFYYAQWCNEGLYEETLTRNCIIELLEGIANVFICDYREIVIMTEPNAKMRIFYTEDEELAINPDQKVMVKKGERLSEITRPMTPQSRFGFSDSRQLDPNNSIRSQNCAQPETNSNQSVIKSNEAQPITDSATTSSGNQNNSSGIDWVQAIQPDINKSQKSVQLTPIESNPVKSVPAEPLESSSIPIEFLTTSSSVKVKNKPAVTIEPIETVKNDINTTEIIITVTNEKNKSANQIVVNNDIIKPINVTMVQEQPTTNSVPLNQNEQSKMSNQNVNDVNQISMEMQSTSFSKLKNDPETEKHEYVVVHTRSPRQPHTSPKPIGNELSTNVPYNSSGSLRDSLNEKLSDVATRYEVIEANRIVVKPMEQIGKQPQAILIPDRNSLNETISNKSKMSDRPIDSITSKAQNLEKTVVSQEQTKMGEIRNAKQEVTILSKEKFKTTSLKKISSTSRSVGKKRVSNDPSKKPMTKSKSPKVISKKSPMIKQPQIMPGQDKIGTSVSGYPSVYALLAKEKTKNFPKVTNKSLSTSLMIKSQNESLMSKSECSVRSKSSSNTTSPLPPKTSPPKPKNVPKPKVNSANRRKVVLDTIKSMKHKSSASRLNKSKKRDKSKSGKMSESKRFVNQSPEPKSSTTSMSSFKKEDQMALSRRESANNAMVNSMIKHLKTDEKQLKSRSKTKPRKSSSRNKSKKKTKPKSSNSIRSVGRLSKMRKVHVKTELNSLIDQLMAFKDSNKAAQSQIDQLSEKERERRTIETDKLKKKLKNIISILKLMIDQVSEPFRADFVHIIKTMELYLRNSDPEKFQDFSDCIIDLAKQIISIFDCNK
ncbi:hypothetical protein RDWZM_006441 [Blomia tropicalis]|uniref:Uncharacterized protein n=1 Tax=Blomia tropicalis TaxID=40697 RepID=A0A9Q0RNB6_BLOTA|nr:hypothetical protein RDWZM_006441 [Blomia tropicalis]